MRCLQALLLSLLFGAGLAQAASGVRAEEPWVREAPPTATVLAGYLILVNDSRHDLVLDSVSSPQFGSVQIHETMHDNGMTGMRQVPSLPLPAGNRIEFAPGGLHLMLMQPNTVLRQGDSVALVLHFADGTQLEVQAPVRRSTGGGMAQHHHAH